MKVEIKKMDKTFNYLSFYSSSLPQHQSLQNYLTFTYNIAFRYIPNHHDAEEISQEVLLTIFKKSSSFRGQSSVKTWIYRITVNTCLNFLKKRKRWFYYSHNQDFWKKPTYCDDPQTTIENRDYYQNFLLAISRLPTCQMKVLKFTFLVGYPQKKTALMMKLSLKAVESLLQRGKKNLRKKILEISEGK